MFEHVRAVVFDVGNTLVHVDEGFLVQFLAARGHRTDTGALRQARNQANRRIEELLEVESNDAERWLPYFDAILAGVGYGDADQRRACSAELRVHDAENSLWRVVEPDTPEVLRALQRRGLRLSVISNSDGRIAALLERLGLADFFELIVDSGSFGVEKPDPRIFEHTLQRLGLPASHCLYVGDLYPIDAVGARAVGMQACLLGEARQGCHGLRNLRELLELI